MSTTGLVVLFQMFLRGQWSQDLASRHRVTVWAAASAGPSSSWPTDPRTRVSHGFGTLITPPYCFALFSWKGESPPNWLHPGFKHNRPTPELQSEFSWPLELLKGHPLHLMEEGVSGRVRLRERRFRLSQLLLKRLVLLQELFPCKVKRAFRTADGLRRPKDLWACLSGLGDTVLLPHIALPTGQHHWITVGIVLEISSSVKHVRISDVERAVIISLHHEVINMQGHRAGLQGHCAAPGTVVF